MDKSKPTTLIDLLAMLVADIDIFLLKDESQENDKEQEYFHRDEIREQLKASLKKFGTLPLAMHQELYNDLQYSFIKNEIDKLRKKHLKNY